MSLKVGLLKENLQELYYSLHEAPTNKLNIVANYSGTRIYNAGNGWGRFWRVFYSLTTKIFGHSERVNKLKKALIHTHTLFHEQLSIVQVHLKNYQYYLKEASSGYKVNDKQLHVDRKAILTWNNATKKFLRVFKDSHHPKLYRFILNSTSIPHQTSAPFATPVDVSSDLCSRIIALEGISASSLPFAAIKNVFKKKPLHLSETKDLKKWVSKLNTQKLQLNKIHKGIASIADFFKHRQNNKEFNYTPEVLELFLEEIGCRVFEQSDPKHISWRKRECKSGASISNGTTSYVLGKQLGQILLKEGRALVFDLPSMPQNIALMPPNRIKLSLERLKPPLQPISSAKIVEIMDGGRWALIERLSPINSHPWTTTETISKEDTPKIRAFVSLIKTCIETNSTPSNFSPGILMFDTEGNLKTLYPTPSGPFNFNALENFALRASAGNFSIFQSIMKASGLIHHSVAKYYLAIAVATLKKQAVHIANLGGVYHIGDSQVIDRASSFAKELSQLQTDILTHLQRQYPECDHEILEQRVEKEILKQYQNSATASFLWPTLAKSIIKTFSNYRESIL